MANKMTKIEIKKVVEDFLKKKTDKSITFDDVQLRMAGCYYWDGKEYVRRAMLGRFLDYQCRRLDRTVDDLELESNCAIFRKSVIMV